VRRMERVTIALQKAAEHIRGHGWSGSTASLLVLLILKIHVFSHEYVMSLQPPGSSQPVAWLAALAVAEVLPPLGRAGAGSGTCRSPFFPVDLADVGTGNSMSLRARACQSAGHVQSRCRSQSKLRHRPGLLGG
jgi:hypothetical protein